MQKILAEIPWSRETDGTVTYVWIDQASCIWLEQNSDTITAVLVDRRLLPEDNYSETFTGTIEDVRSFVQNKMRILDIPVLYPNIRSEDLYYSVMGLKKPVPLDFAEFLKSGWKITLAPSQKK